MPVITEYLKTEFSLTLGTYFDTHNCKHSSENLPELFGNAKKNFVHQHFCANVNNHQISGTHCNVCVCYKINTSNVKFKQILNLRILTRWNLKQARGNALEPNPELTVPAK